MYEATLEQAVLSWHSKNSERAKQPDSEPVYMEIDNGGDEPHVWNRSSVVSRKA
jgi:hypothetical protein